jgi:hypothetical protein
MRWLAAACERLNSPPPRRRVAEAAGEKGKSVCKGGVSANIRRRRRRRLQLVALGAARAEAGASEARWTVLQCALARAPVQVVVRLRRLAIATLCAMALLSAVIETRLVMGVRRRRLRARQRLFIIVFRLPAKRNRSTMNPNSRAT